MNLPDISLATAAVAAVTTAGLTFVLLPLLKRYALARPNARSSHTIPTPQGAGIAIIAATIAVAGTGISIGLGEPFPAALFGATLVIAAVGAIDDIRTIPVAPRLLLQGLCAAVALHAGRFHAQIFPFLPAWAEYTVLFLAVLWFINLVNFMDGLDLMTVVETVPVAGALVVIGWLGALPEPTVIVAAALLGATVGFAPFNRPVAKVFMGDVGSLPVGLLLASCLIELAAQNVVAALLLPLYYLADATITLLRRLARREAVWIAHRSHFYQQATTNGYRVGEVVARVFVLNLLLAALGITAVVTESLMTQAILLTLGAVAVAMTLARFAFPQLKRRKTLPHS